MSQFSYLHAIFLGSFHPLETTLTELDAMANAASGELSQRRMPAAIGISAVLRPNAQPRFCQMARDTPGESPPKRRRTPKV